MTMTINTKKQFFRAQIWKNLLLIILILLLAACTKSKTFKTEAFKTQSGWGYSIAYKNKMIIKQSIIPVLNDTKSFSNEDDALKVGNLVAQKLRNGISPSVTKNDLILLKIKI